MSTCSSLAVLWWYCASVLYTVVKHSCILHYKQRADKNVHLPRQFKKNLKKSISWDSRAWTANLFSYSQQTPVKQVAPPDHFKWLFKRSKNCCWSKYYLKNCINKIELLTVAKYKLNYGRTYTSLSPAQILLGVHFKYTIQNLQIIACALWSETC